MSNFFQLLAEKFTETPEHASFLEKLLVSAYPWFLMLFYEMSNFFQLLAENLTKKPKHAS